MSHGRISRPYSTLRVPQVVLFARSLASSFYREQRCNDPGYASHPEWRVKLQAQSSKANAHPTMTMEPVFTRRVSGRNLYVTSFGGTE